MKNKYHTYLVVYMANHNGTGVKYGSKTCRTASTGEELALFAEATAINHADTEQVVIINICKLD